MQEYHCGMQGEAARALCLLAAAAAAHVGERRRAFLAHRFGVGRFLSLYLPGKPAIDSTTSDPAKTPAAAITNLPGG